MTTTVVMAVRSSIRVRAAGSAACIAAVGPYDTTMAEAWDHLRQIWERRICDEAMPKIFHIELEDVDQDLASERRRFVLSVPIGPMARAKLHDAVSIRPICAGAHFVAAPTTGLAALPRHYRSVRAALGLDLRLRPDASRPVVLFVNRIRETMILSDCALELGIPLLDGLAR